MKTYSRGLMGVDVDLWPVKNWKRLRRETENWALDADFPGEKTWMFFVGPFVFWFRINTYADEAMANDAPAEPGTGLV